MLKDLFFPGHSNELWFLVVVVGLSEQLIEHIWVHTKFLQTLGECAGKDMTIWGPLKNGLLFGWTQLIRNDDNNKQQATSNKQQPTSNKQQI